MPPKKATTTTSTTKKTTTTATTAKKTTTTSKPSTTKKTTTSATGAKKSVSKTTKKEAPKKEEKAEQPKQEEQKQEETKEEEKKEDVVGKAQIKYNHYDKSFPTLNGEMKFTDIDEEYCISFVFEGEFGRHLQKEGGDGKYLQQKDFVTDKVDDEGKPIKESIFYGVEDGAIYKLVIVEDEVAEAQREHVGYKAPEQEKEEKRGEGCSCVFGNPCQDKYVCLDWNNREAVAKKNGWKGFS